MIISRTPFRISLFGGGTDYPEWYLREGGAVLSTTIDKYCYLMCRYLPPFFEHRIAVRYSRIETCDDIESIQHPAVRAVLRHLSFGRGLEINHDGDLPARSGMGSSSAFTVGLLHALEALQGRSPSPTQLARLAIHLERDVMGETVGSQDQVAAAFGGFNRIDFLSSGDFQVRPMRLPQRRQQELHAHLLLVYTGTQRTASNIARSFVPHLGSFEPHLTRSRAMVEEASALLSTSSPLTPLGDLLHEAWLAKRSMSPLVSTARVDGIYQAARSAGALGGKLVGAGGGGFLLLFVEPDRRAAVCRRLRSLLTVPFSFESSGTQVIFSDTERDYAEQDALRSRVRPSVGGRAWPPRAATPEPLDAHRELAS